MDIVLGVSMAPATIRMVLVEGENADGVTVDEDNFDANAPNDAATLSGPDQVISAILGTREGAADAGCQLTSTGVTWTDPADAAALCSALAARKIENVMLVSAFLAAAALAQTVGHAIGYEHTAMLFVEPETATLAVVDSADGSVADVYRRPLRSPDTVAELAAMIADVDAAETRPEGLFIVGSGVDVSPIKPALEAATCLPVSAPEEPAMALARGAALASANAPLFASSTAALAYAQDPGTGAVDPYAVSPGYLDVPVHRAATELSEGDLAYSAVPDDEAAAETAVVDVAQGGFDASEQRRRPLLLVGSASAVIVVTAALALEVALALGIRPAVALRPTPHQALIVPAEQAPSPPAAQVVVPQPQAVQLPTRAAPPPLNVPAPALPAPAAPAPVPVPAAPAPVPVPAAPVPVLIPIPVRPGIPAPVHLPAPQPPVNLPVTRPPVRLPSPPAHVPSPPVRQQVPPVREPTPPVWEPTPPVRMPVPPVREPVPPVQMPTPPVREPLPQPPVNLPAPEPPVNLPAPAAPQLPAMPAPAAPQLPAMPAPEVPRMPVMPAPAAPVMPPVMPVMPHFNFPIPAFRF